MRLGTTHKKGRCLSRPAKAALRAIQSMEALSKGTSEKSIHSHLHTVEDNGTSPNINQPRIVFRCKKSVSIASVYMCHN